MHDQQRAQLLERMRVLVPADDVIAIDHPLDHAGVEQADATDDCHLSDFQIDALQYPLPVPGT
ncbi:hypothetical protein D3C71_2061350 [compost metagenome]